MIASVTGCSTCSRVFISMNQKRSGRRPLAAVGDELDRAGAGIADGPRRLDRGLAHRRRASPRVMPGAGASSITF